MKILLISVLFFINLSAQEKALTFNECVNLTVNYSRDLKVASEQLKQVMLNKEAKFAVFLPSVDASFSDKLLGFDGTGKEIALGTLNPDTYSASLSASYNLYNMFKDIDRFDYSRKQYESELLTFASKKQDVVYSIVNSYYNLLSAEKTLAVRQKALEQRKEYYKLTESLYKSGIKSRSDFLNSQIQIKKSEVSLLDAEFSLKQTRGSLNVLLGIPVEKETVIADDNVFMEPDIVFEKYVQTVLAGNLELKKMKVQREYTAISLRLSEKGLLPAVSLDASYTLTLDSYARPSSEWTHFGRLDQNSSWGLMLSLSYPIFDGGVSRIQRDLAVSALTVIDMNIFNKEIDLIEQSYNSVLEIRKTYQELILYKEQVEMAKENLLLVKNRYQTGIASFLDLTDAEYNYIAAEISYYQLIYDYKIQLFAIDKLKGQIGDKMQVTGNKQQDTSPH